MKTNKILLSLIAAFMLVISTSSFGAIVYDVNRTIGAGSVTGTVTTDGTLGVLLTSNFLDWELLLNDSITSLTLFGPNSGSTNSGLSIVGSDFSATSSDLIFDFNGIGYALFQNPNPGSGINYWCLDASNCTGEPTGESVYFNGPIQLSSLSGQQVIASVSSVPVPAAVWLFGSALMGLVGVRRKKA